MIFDVLQVKVEGKVVYMMTREEGFFNGIDVSFNIIKNNIINKTIEDISKPIEEKTIEPEVVKEDEKEEERQVDIQEVQEEIKMKVEPVRRIVMKSPDEWACELYEAVFEELKTVKKNQKIYTKDIYEIVARKGVPTELVEDTGVEVLRLFKMKGKIAGK